MTSWNKYFDSLSNKSTFICQIFLNNVKDPFIPNQNPKKAAVSHSSLQGPLPVACRLVRVFQHMSVLTAGVSDISLSLDCVISVHIPTSL